MLIQATDIATFRRWAEFEFSVENWREIFIPNGFAHGFMTLEPGAEIVYKCSDYYAPKAEGALCRDEPDLATAWSSLAGPPVLSGRDAGARGWARFVSPFVMAPA